MPSAMDGGQSEEGKDENVRVWSSRGIMQGGVGGRAGFSRKMSIYGLKAGLRLGGHGCLAGQYLTVGRVHYPPDFYT